MSRFARLNTTRFATPSCHWRFRPTQHDASVHEKATDYAGVGLFAQRNIPNKESFCSAAAGAMMALDTDRLHNCCYLCFTREDDPADLRPWDMEVPSNTKLKKCEVCEMVKFCSVECEKKAYFFFHRHECEIFLQLSPRVPPSNLRAVLRLLLLRKSGQIDSETWVAVKKSRSHMKGFRRRGGERWDQLCTLTQCAMEYSKTTESFETVIKLFCSLLVNGLPIQTKYFETIGVAMHPLMAKINHHCQPNSIITFDRPAEFGNPFMKVTALRSIAKDEEINIAYVDTVIPRKLRVHLLKDVYFFKCRCGECTSDAKEDGPSTRSDICQLLLKRSGMLSPSPTAPVKASATSRIQEWRYVVHLSLTNGWSISVQPLPAALHHLAMAYLEDLQINMALVFAAILHYRANSAIYQELHHPVAFNHGFMLHRLMECVLQGNEWSTQTLNLVSKELELVFLQEHLLWRLCKASASVQMNEIKARILGARNRGNLMFTDAQLGDEELLEMAMVNMDKLMEDVLNDIKAWR